MCRLLLKHYDRPKEVIPALAMIVERTGYVKLEGGRLEVTLRRFTDREIDYAARHLCEDLNRMQPVPLDKFLVGLLLDVVTDQKVTFVQRYCLHAVAVLDSLHDHMVQSTISRY